jgi:CRISPR/Cas system-associated exonuclease Cas4 (RecB family)
MGYINKTVFLNYISCPTLGWKTKRGGLPKLEGLNNELLFMEGKRVHKLSYELFPSAVNAQKRNIDEAAAYTREILQNPDNKIVLEASFVAQGCSVRVDILERDAEGFILYEIKSGSKYKAKYMTDLAYSAMVLSKNGVNLTRFELKHLSGDYRLGMPAENLFSSIECTEKVQAKLDGFLSVFDKAKSEIEGDTMPAPYLKRSCKNCPLFDECMGKGAERHIFDLPRLSVLAIDELTAMGADTVDKIPEDYELTEMQKIVKNCMINDCEYVSPNLKTELENIKKPYYYLDFESVTTIMPLYPGISPHTQLLTQFSVDKSETLGDISRHFEYIADHTRDCRREIAEKLVEYLGTEGSIITYASFERIAVSKLASMFADLCRPLTEISERIIDLELLVRKNYYNAAFHGRSSIKKVLPVMIKNMNYEGLEIGEGGDAAAAFAFMAMGLYDEEKIKRTKESLLKYCAQDTFAMLKIHQFLENKIGNSEV